MQRRDYIAINKIVDEMNVGIKLLGDTCLVMGCVLEYPLEKKTLKL